jgi:hypothetical protein
LKARELKSRSAVTEPYQRLDFSQIAARRSQVYGLQRETFNGLPSTESLLRLASSPLLDAAATGSPVGEQAVASLRAVIGESGDCSSIVKDIAVERTRLLRGIRPGQGLPPACECVYRPSHEIGECNVHGAGALLLQKYNSAGFVADGSVPPDFLGSELGFMEFLVSREAQAWQQDDGRSVLALAEAQLAFLDNHIGRWIGPLQEAVRSEVSSGFWAAMLVLTETHLQMEREYLQQLLDPGAGDREDSDSGTTSIMGAEIHAKCL